MHYNIYILDKNVIRNYLIDNKFVVDEPIEEDNPSIPLINPQEID